jgi:hypothetical protein
VRLKRIGSSRIQRTWLEIDEHIFQESSHVKPALIIKPLQRFASACIIRNLSEKWQTVSDCGIRFGPNNQPFPAPRSRVVIRLPENMKAKPNANSPTLRPDNCLVVLSLFPGLRPGCPRNTAPNAATTREDLRPS